MKIKFILVPTAIIIAIVLMIWNIWPNWFSEDMENSIKNLRADIAKEESAINNIKNKKNNIQSLSEELQNNQSDKDLFFGYYPFIRKEEDIVNKINHVALGSGIFLEEVLVEYGKIDKKNKSEQILAIKSGNKAINQKTSIEENILSSENSKIAEVQITPRFMDANISVYGEYAQIKSFLTSLQDTGLLNNVRYFDIYKEEAEPEEGEDGVGKLNANILISFGYVSRKKNTVESLIDNKLISAGKFDLETMNEEKKRLMEKKYPISEVGEVGDENPFLP
jgi:Tfp pilus assembly protein PilO